MNQQPRPLALKVCLKVLLNGASLTDALDETLEQLESDRDKAFCSELCYGFCRYYFVLDGILKTLITKPLKERDRDVKVILMLGLYQIRFMRVSDHAAVNESVKLLNQKRKAWAKGLVNGVLRSYLRQCQSSTPAADESTRGDLTEDEVYRSYPGWMRERITIDWQPEAFEVLAAGNRQAPMVIRVDLNQRSRAEQLELLKQHSISADAHPYIAQAIILDKAHDVSRIPGFEQGIVSVQDAAAQIAADLLDSQTGMKVLDACAAPGGKTLHILQATPRIDLTALDKDQNRIQRIRENLQRAGVDAEIRCADAATPVDWHDGVLFDRILLDAPCSASGIIRRHPDIRLLRKSSDIDTLVDLQQRLLNSLWPLLKPGGKMVYSTCSIFKAENERQVERFVGAQDRCVEQPINTVQWGQRRPFGRQILPGTQQMDGFYYACLEKTVL